MLKNYYKDEYKNFNCSGCYIYPSGKVIWLNSILIRFFKILSKDKMYYSKKSKSNTMLGKYYSFYSRLIEDHDEVMKLVIASYCLSPNFTMFNFMDDKFKKYLGNKHPDADYISEKRFGRFDGKFGVKLFPLHIDPSSIDGYGVVIDVSLHLEKKHRFGFYSQFYDQILKNPGRFHEFPKELRDKFLRKSSNYYDYNKDLVLSYYGMKPQNEFKIYGEKIMTKTGFSYDYYFNPSMKYRMFSDEGIGLGRSGNVYQFKTIAELKANILRLVNKSVKDPMSNVEIILLKEGTALRNHPYSYTFESGSFDGEFTNLNFNMKRSGSGYDGPGAIVEYHIDTSNIDKDIDSQLKYFYNS
jgi:hypothetical protein